MASPFTAACLSCNITHSLTPALPQVVGTMKELYSFTGSSNATLDLSVGNELGEGGRASEACPPGRCLLVAACMRYKGSTSHRRSLPALRGRCMW